jgi:hypothetical protein
MIGSKRQWSGLVDRPVTRAVKLRRESEKICVRRDVPGIAGVPRIASR